MMNRLSLISAICGLAFAANAANAAITEVFSVAGLTQGPYSLETFDDLTLVPGVIASSTGGITLADALWAPSFPSGTTGLRNDSGKAPIVFTFATAVSSVGLFFGNDDTCCSSGFSANLNIFGTSGLLGTLSVAANMNDAVDQFIGFVSNELVTSVSISYDTGSAGLYTVVDDLRFNSTTPPPVPLPAGLPLAATGLAALAFFKRRKT